MASIKAAELAANGHGRLALRGALTFETVPALWQQSRQLLALTGEAITVNLADVETVDSAGLALLVAWRAKAEAAGRALRYEALSERLLALARISEVESLLQQG